MKIAFFSNFLNHHQLPLCQGLIEKTKGEFVFVACEAICADRVNMGYEDMNKQYPFVLRAYESEENEKKAEEIAKTYDVAIIAGVPLKYLKMRMDKNLLTFRFAERTLKKGTWRRFIPRTRKNLKEGYLNYKNKRLYVIGASAYAASDLVLCGFDKKKCFTWGYFPKVYEKNIDKLFELKRENKVPEILYAGRLLKLKRVLDTVKSVHALVKNGIYVHFTIIGEGECKQEIKSYISKNKLEKYVTMLPFMSPEEVRKYMDKSDIYVFGSNFYEGWGAVVNEAMNSCCAVVVSHSVGSSACLIDNGKNGYVYELANVKKLTSILSQLAQNAELRESLGRNAYETLTTKWSAKTAAERLCKISEALLDNKDYEELYASGPCSLSNILKNNWVKER